MSSTTANNKRIAKNTIALYIRMLVILAVNLYTSRVVLEQLGVEDFGIYNLVGGVVSALTILTNSLSSACSRFINYEQGTGNISKLKSIVSTSFNIQIILSVVVILLLESFGIWFLNNHLSIPSHRLEAANWVLQFSIATFVVRLIIVPLNSLIISHEKMSVYAYLSVVDVVMQLLVVYLLNVSSMDKLVLYSFLMMLVPVILFFIYLAYCKIQFEECCHYLKFERDIFKEMAGFAGWNFVGVTAGVLRNQGIDIIINLFFGVVLNASRGIATQVSTAVSRFSSGFTTAINPQITKSYAAGDIARTQFLIHQGSRFSFYLMMCIVIPLFLEMDIILRIWLKTVPQYAVIFSQLIVIENLLACLSHPLITALLATGRIKKYQLLVGFFNILNFPISYLLLYLGFQPYITYIVMIFIEFGCLYFRLYMIRENIGIKITPYFRNVFLNVILVTIFALIFPSVCVLLLSEGMARLSITIVISIISSMLFICVIGLNKQERNAIINRVIKK